jgi:phage/plasmid-like protein (TIGR03299 family)
VPGRFLLSAELHQKETKLVAAPVARVDYAVHTATLANHTYKVPWTTAGVRLGHVLTAEEALQAAGLDWKVDLLKVYVRVDGHLVEFPDARAIVRDSVPGTKDSTRFLKNGLSDHYKPVQNVQGFEFFDRVVRAGEAMYHSAGSFYGGRIVFIVAQLPQDIVVADRSLIKQFLLLTNAHDGSRQLRMGYMPLVSDTGTLLGTATSRRYSVAIRHIGSDINSRIAQSRRALGIIKTWAEAAPALYGKMAACTMDEQATDAYLKTLFPDKKDDKTTKAADERLAAKVLSGAADRFGQSTRPVSLYDLYVGTARVIDETAKPSTKISSIWFGDRARTKEKAMSQAMALLNKLA